MRRYVRKRAKAEAWSLQIGISLAQRAGATMGSATSLIVQFGNSIEELFLSA
jgi:hypothetical protein